MHSSLRATLLALIISLTTMASAIASPAPHEEYGGMQPSRSIIYVERGVLGDLNQDVDELVQSPTMASWYALDLKLTAELLQGEAEEFSIEISSYLSDHFNQTLAGEYEGAAAVDAVTPTDVTAPAGSPCIDTENRGVFVGEPSLSNVEGAISLECLDATFGCAVALEGYLLTALAGQSFEVSTCSHHHSSNCTNSAALDVNECVWMDTEWTPQQALLTYLSDIQRRLPVGLLEINEQDGTVTVTGTGGHSDSAAAHVQKKGSGFRPCGRDVTSFYIQRVDIDETHVVGTMEDDLIIVDDRALYPLYIDALAGDDCIFASRHSDTIYAGPGNDEVFAVYGGDWISGGPGDDTLWGSNGDRRNPGDDDIYGDGGNDHIYGGGGRDWLDGGPGFDFIKAGSGVDLVWAGDDGGHLIGDSETDYLYGGPHGDTLNGDSGNDEIFGHGGSDTLIGGSGGDWLRGGGGGEKLIQGDSGNDLIWGGDETSFSDDGADVIRGDSGSDEIYGQLGNDRIDADSGNDFVRGGDGHDIIYGRSGADQLYGDCGDDTLYGGDFSSDWLIGGTPTSNCGSDYADGGLGHYSGWHNHCKGISTYRMANVWVGPWPWNWALRPLCHAHA